MRHLFSFAVFAVSMSFAAAAAAQSAQDVEKGAFALCMENTGTELAKKACSEWMVDAARIATYKMRIHELTKFSSESDLLSYRELADRKLVPEKTEAMTAFEINLDILNALEDDDDRIVRMKRLIFWAERLTPEQRRIAAREIVLLDDFSKLVQQKVVRGFIEKCRDEAVSFVPDVNSDTKRFLDALEQAKPELINASAAALLFLSEAESGQFVSARNHLKMFDILSIDKKLAENVVSVASKNASKFFNDVKFIDCYPEFAHQYKATGLDKLLMQMWQIEKNPGIAGNVAAAYVAACDIQAATAAVFEAFDAAPQKLHAQVALDTFIAYVERSKNDLLMVKTIEYAAKLNGQTLNFFIRNYAAKLKNSAFDTGMRALERNDAAAAVTVLGGLRQIFGNDPEILLAYGRALQAQHMGAQARVMWDEVIQNKSMQGRVEQAYYFSILSFRSDNNEKEAKELLKQFADEFPGSSYLEMLELPAKTR